MGMAFTGHSAVLVDDAAKIQHDKLFCVPNSGAQGEIRNANLKSLSTICTTMQEVHQQRKLCLFVLGRRTAAASSAIAFKTQITEEP